MEHLDSHTIKGLRGVCIECTEHFRESMRHPEKSRDELLASMIGIDMETYYRLKGND